MGFFSLDRFRRRDFRRQPKLPVYEQLSPTKERFSNDDEYSTSESDDDLSDCSDGSMPSSRSTRSSRQTSGSHSSSGLLRKKPAFPIVRRPARTYLYRLPNRVVRYLCLALMTTLIVFIIFLVRASQIENRKIAEGKIAKKPPPPPVWESFDFLQRYYGGIRTLQPLDQNVPEYPRSEDELPFNGTAPEASAKRDPITVPAEHMKRGLPASKPFPKHPRAVFANQTANQAVECFLDKSNTVRVPSIRYYDGRPMGFPENILGSYELLSLPEEICFERYGRFGPYGLGYSVSKGGMSVGEHGEKEGFEAVWDEVERVDYRKVDWADAQRRCYQSNANRFKPLPSRSAHPEGFYIGGDMPTSSPAAPVTERSETSAPESAAATPSSGDLPRTAVVLRVWDEFNWREEDILHVRSLISELSLASGSRYDVHLLVQVRNDARNPVWADDDIYRARVRETVPEEFQGMVTLWSVTQMLAVYQGVHDLWTKGPELPVHGVYRGLQMAMQHFAHNHPEYDYFWQWEMDIRYTGHWYDLLAKLEGWSREQPRKGLWERNGRFYVPSVHGTWEEFKQMARVQSEMGTLGADNMWDRIPGRKGSPEEVAQQQPEKPVWGPLRPADSNDWFQAHNDPLPPTTYEKDRYTWGVGEEADLITLNPLFDPEGTTWGLADDITGYNGTVPRRAHIITSSRMSRRLLLTMHRETALRKHHAFPEMWPATAALHHGLKAVFAPHPLYVDRAWPAQYLARVLNGGRSGATGGARTAVFGDREHNLRGLTWFYDSGFAPNLYRRWLGLKVNNDGGEEFETTPDLSKNGTSVGDMPGGEGRMCLPPMLLHPVKEVELPAEYNPEGELEVPESDPAA